MDEMEKKVELESKLIDEEEVGEVTAGSTKVEVTFIKGSEGSAATPKDYGAKADVVNNTKGTFELSVKKRSDLIGSRENCNVL